MMRFAASIFPSASSGSDMYAVKNFDHNHILACLKMGGTPKFVTLVYNVMTDIISLVQSGNLTRQEVIRISIM